MRIAELSPAAISAGRVVTWTMSPATLAAARSQPLDPRPVTANQEAHLVNSARRGAADAADLRRPGGDVRVVGEPVTGRDADSAPWIGLGVQLAGATEHSVPAALHRFIERHETLRSVICLDHADGTAGTDGTDGTRPARRTVPAAAIELVPTDLGQIDDPAAAYARVSEHLAQHTDPLRWPSYGFVTVAADGDVTLYAAWDHLHFDGFSMVIALCELPVIHADVVSARTCSLPAAGSFADYAAQERAACAGLTRDDARMEPWIKLLADDGGLPGLPAATGVAIDDRLPQRTRSIPLATPARSQAFADHAASQGIAPSTAFLAVLLAQIAETDDGHFAGLLSTHNRAQARWLNAVGWFAGLAPVAISFGGATDLSTICALTEQARQASQAAAELPFSLVNQVLGVPLVPTLVVSYLDVRRVPGHDVWSTTRCQGYLGRVMPSAGMHIWLNRYHDEGLLLEVRGPDTDRCNAWVGQLGERIRHSLHAPTGPEHR